MPTSTAIQSRIAALEASARQSNVRPPSPTTPNVGNKSSPIDLHDWVLDDMPPSAPNLHFQPNSSPKLKPKPKPKPPALQVKSANGKCKSPPLPPRKNTQDSDTSLLYPPLGGVEAGNGENGRRGNHGQASSVSSFHSVSLSSDTDPGTPSSVGNMIATYPIDRVPSSSSLTESFEEISIPPPPLPQRPSSMTNSTYSYSSPSTPTPLPYVPRRVPPPPPSRASDRSSIQSSTSSSQSRRSSSSVQTPTLIATLPLPPPPSALSPATPNTKRPTPVPSAARKRYIAVFNANIIQRRRAEVITANQPRQLTHAEAKRTRQAAGWRGLSVDLITATPEELEDVKGKYKEQDPPQVDGIIGPHDRLEGNIVKVIWSRSRIEKSKLAEIWNECDTEGVGSLDLESFIRGMWRIDEHLRRTQAQTSALRNASSASLTSLRSGLGSLKMKPGRNGSLHRSTSKSSLGTSLSRSSSVSSRPPTNAYSEYPPPPVPKIILR